MVEKKDLKKIIETVKEDFHFLKKDVLGVVLFGSASEGKGWKDIDICIVAPKRDPKKILKEIYRKIDVSKKKYDVHVFETLPLYVKIEIIKKHVLVYGDPYELAEYFYTFRKIWKDQKHRQKLTKEEMLEILKA